MQLTKGQLWVGRPQGIVVMYSSPSDTFLDPEIPYDPYTLWSEKMCI
jgi:hypothetical protein